MTVQKQNQKKEKGFTLIEILVVIGIIAILAAVVLIAINPAKQFAQARDSQRSSNVNAILNGVGQYIADNKGKLPPELPSAGSGAADISSSDADLCSDLVPTYLPAFPTDPDSSTHEGETIKDCSVTGGYESGYTVEVDTNNRVTISAPNTENAANTIEVIR